MAIFLLSLLLSSINKHFLSTEIKFKTYHKTTHHCKCILPWSLYGILHSFENNPLRFQIDAFLHKPKTNKWDIISNKALNNKLYSIGTGKIFINIINIPMIAFLKCHLFCTSNCFWLSLMLTVCTRLSMTYFLEVVEGRENDFMSPTD